MFRVPDGIDPKVRKVLQDIQGILFKLAKQGSVLPRTPRQGLQMISSAVGGEVTENYAPDGTIHGDLFVDGTIHGGVASVDLNPAVSDVTASRALNTVYQNGNSTMIRVDVSVELT